MREIRQSGSEGGVALTTPSLPLSIGSATGASRLARRGIWGMSLRVFIFRVWWICLFEIHRGDAA